MKQVKLFRNLQSDEEINQFLKTTNGILVDIKFTSTVLKMEGKDGMNRMGSLSNALVIFDIKSSGGMQ